MEIEDDEPKPTVYFAGSEFTLSKVEFLNLLESGRIVFSDGGEQEMIDILRAQLGRKDC